MPNSSSDNRTPASSVVALASSQNNTAVRDAQAIKTQEVAQALVRRLQASLETEALIHWFTEGVRPVLGSLFCAFSSDMVSSTSGSDQKAHHSAHYNLTLEGLQLGQIEFRRNTKFSEDDLACLETLLGSLVFPLRNSLQYKEALNAAMTDALTGISNKRSFDSQIHREVASARRYDTELALVVFDVDFFKKINDTYGHNAGDAVLKQLTTVVENNCRDSDMVFRLGGEEFSILLSKTDLQGAKAIADRIRQAVADTTFCYDGSKIPVTISLGVAAHHGNESRKSLLERADQALYAAKRSGRNRVIAADEYRGADDGEAEPMDRLSI